MIALDTNILARFITCDDEIQSALSKKLILAYKGKAQSIYINNIVLCELCWLLKSGYKYSRQQISTVLQMLLDIEEFSFSNRDLILEATLLYKNKKGDFADYLIYAINYHEGYEYTYSFDHKMVADDIFKQMTGEIL